MEGLGSAEHCLQGRRIPHRAGPLLATSTSMGGFPQRQFSQGCLPSLAWAIPPLTPTAGQAPPAGTVLWQVGCCGSTTQTAMFISQPLCLKQTGTERTLIQKLVKTDLQANPKSRSQQEQKSFLRSIGFNPLETPIKTRIWPRKGKG